MDVEVKMKNVDNELVVPRPDIKMRLGDEPLEKVRIIADRKHLWKGHGKELAAETKFIDQETQQEVPGSEVLEVLDHYSYEVLSSKWEIVDEKAEGDFIEYYFAGEKGEAQFVRPFKRTEVLEIPDENWAPSTSMDDFLITSEYEVFSEKKADVIKLWEEAEKRLKEDTIGITTFSHGRGFLQYYAFLVPIVQSGKFVWLLKLTDTKVRLSHLQEIPSKVKIPIREAPTLETLPPIQMIITQKRKVAAT
jgi:hypothetical protein